MAEITGYLATHETRACLLLQQRTNAGIVGFSVKCQ